MSNGLCNNQGTDLTSIYRNSCSDQTWGSDNCPQYCESPMVNRLRLVAQANKAQPLALVPRSHLVYMLNGTNRYKLLQALTHGTQVLEVKSLEASETTTSADTIP